MTSLWSFSAWGNGLSGALPTQLGRWAGSRYLKLQNNGISGWLPTELGALGSTLELQLYKNELSGTLPSELGWLSSATNAPWSVALHDNRLSGSVPTEMYALGGCNLRGNNVCAHPLATGSCADSAQATGGNRPAHPPPRPPPEGSDAWLRSCQGLYITPLAADAGSQCPEATAGATAALLQRRPVPPRHFP